MKIKFETQARNVNRLKQASHFAPPAVADGAPAAGNGRAVQQDGLAGGAGIPAGDVAEDIAQQDDLNGPSRPNARLSDSPKTAGVSAWNWWQYCC